MALSDTVLSHTANAASVNWQGLSFSSSSSATFDVVFGAPTVSAGALVVGHGRSQNVSSLIGSLITPVDAGDTETVTAVTGNASLAGAAVTYTAPASGTNSFSYPITDQYGATAIGTVNVTVDPGPALVSTAPTVVGHGQTVAVGTVTPGLAGDVLTLQVGQAPAAGTLSLVNGLVSYTANATVSASGATDSFSYAIGDGYGDVSVTVNSTLTVDPGPKVVGSARLVVIPGRAATVGTATPGLVGDVLTMGSATDPTGGTLSMSSGIVTFTPGTSTVTGPSAHALVIQVRDAYGDVSAPVTVTIDRAPVALLLPNQTATDAGPFTVTLPAATFTDPDGDALSLSAKLANGAALPSWLTFDAASGTFQGTPTFGSATTYAIQILADDRQGGTAKTTLNLSVTHQNVAPAGIAVSGSRVAADGSITTIGTLSATDRDGDPITFSLGAVRDKTGTVLASPPFAVVGNQLRLVEGAAAALTPFDTYQVDLVASDGQLSTTRTVPILVTPGVNHPFGISTSDPTAGGGYGTSVPLVRLGSGGYLAVWTGSDGSYAGVLAQALDADGVRVGGETVVNTWIDTLQIYPSAVALSNGGAVVVWADYSAQGGSATYRAQLFDANGAKTGSQIQLVDPNDYNVRGARLAASGSGFLLTWEDTLNSLTSTFIQHFGADGSALDTPQVVAPVSAGAPSITLKNGDTVTASFDYSSYNDQSTGGAVITHAGGPSIVMATDRVGTFQALAPLSDGRFVMAWTASTPGYVPGLYARIFNADGSPSTAAVQVNSTLNFVGNVSIATVGSDRILVSWMSSAYLAGNSTTTMGADTAFGQLLGLDGRKLGPEMSWASVQGYANSIGQSGVVAAGTGRVLSTWRETDYNSSYSTLSTSVKGGFFALSSDAAVADAATVPETPGTVLFDVVANDADPSATLVAVSSAQIYGNSSAVVQEVVPAAITNGKVALTLGSDFVGLRADTSAIVRVTYTTRSAAGQTAQGELLVTVQGVNQAPVAVDDTFQTPKNIAAGRLGKLLANDTDADNGDRLSTLAEQKATSRGGTVTIQANGSFLYTPAIDFTGTDSFTYTTLDGYGGTASATARITVGGPVERAGGETTWANGSISPGSGAPAMVASGGGEVLVSTTYRNYNGLYERDVSLQRYTSTGALIGSALNVDTTTYTDQFGGNIAKLTGGGFLVWYKENAPNRNVTSGPDSNSGTLAGWKAQIFDSNLSRIGGEITLASINTDNVAVAAAPDGGFVTVVGDVETGYTATGALAQYYNGSYGPYSSGSFPQTFVQSSDVAPLTTGGYVASLQTSHGVYVYKQANNFLATPLGPVFETDSGASYRSDVEGLANGGAALTYVGFGGPLVLVMFDAAGRQLIPPGSYYGVAVTENLSRYQLGTSSMTPLDNGGVVVTWSERNSTVGPDTGYAVKARVFNPDGTPAGEEFLLNTTTAGAQFLPKVVQLNGQLVFTWLSAASETGPIATGNSFYDFYSDSAVKSQVFNLVPLYKVTAADDLVSMGEDDAPKTFAVLANDTPSTATLVSVGTPVVTTMSAAVLATADVTAAAASGSVSVTLGRAFGSLDAGQSALVDVPYTITDGTGTGTGHLEVTVNGAADPIGPVSDVDATANAVLANAAVGTPVGVTARATDPDAGSTVTYSLLSQTGHFVVDPVSGVASVASSIVALAGTSETMHLQATSSDGTTATRDVVVSIGQPPVGWLPAGTGPEGSLIVLGTLSTKLSSGSTLLSLTVSGLPAGAVLSDGANSFTATASTGAVDVKAWSLLRLKLTAPNATDLTLTATAITRDAQGNQTTAGVATEPVTVNPLAPSPVWQPTLPGLEGTPVALGILSATVNGFPGDGNSLASLTVSGLPIGSVLSDGTNSFTSGAGAAAVDVAMWSANTLRLSTASAANATLTVNAVAKDMQGNLSAAAMASTVVTVAPQAPTVSWASAPLSSLEGQTVALGSLSTFVSELPGETNALASLTISGLTAGTVLSDGTNTFAATAAATAVNVAGWALGRMTVLASGDTDLTLTATAFARDAEGDLSLPSVATEAVRLSPLAPTVSAPAVAGVEGAPLALNVVPAINGLAGDSNSLASLTVSGLPVGTMLSDGTHTFTATATASAVDVAGWVLPALAVTPKNTNNFTLGWVAVTKDAEGTFSTPSPTVAQAVNVSPLAPTVTFTLPARSGVEGSVIALGALSATINKLGGDTNGLASVVVGGLAAGAVLGDGTHTFTATNTATSVDVTAWTLSRLTVTAATASDMALTVTATARDAQGDLSAPATAVQAVTVSPLPATVAWAATPAPGVEGTPVALGVLSATVNGLAGDANSLASLVVSGLPVGGVLSDGTNSFTATAAAASVDVSGWALGRLTLRAPTAANVVLTATVVSRDAQGTLGSAVRATETVTVSPLAPTVAWTATPAPGVEGQPITLGGLSAAVTGLAGDANSLASLVVSGLPVGGVLSDGSHTFTATATAPTVDVSGWALDRLVLTPPNAANVALSAKAVARDAEGNLSAGVTATEAVTVNPLAPTVAWAATPTGGVEGSAIALGTLAATVNGLAGDGNALASLVVSGLSAGTVLSDGTNSFTATATSGSANVAAWSLGRLTVKPGSAVDLALTVTATAKDSVGNLSAPVTATASVAVAPLAPTLGATAVSGVEGTPIALKITAAVNKLVGDGSGNSLARLLVSGLPAGAVLSDGTNSFTATASATTVDVAAWTLASLTLRPPAAADVTLALSATTRDLQGNLSATTTATETVTVRPAARAALFVSPAASFVTEAKLDDPGLTADRTAPASTDLPTYEGGTRLILDDRSTESASSGALFSRPVDQGNASTTAFGQSAPMDDYLGQFLGSGPDHTIAGLLVGPISAWTTAYDGAIGLFALALHAVATPGYEPTRL